MAWWANAVGYEVYLRSFADSDGDGVGDLPGLVQRLDHLAWLGVDLLWVTPFYPSPMADHGYDITDHTAVDPRYGTLADVDALVAGAHERDMRVLVDLVPNHTSDQHPWFVAARTQPEGPHRKYYLWRDGAPDGGPPNNWVSYFGGPAWTHDPVSDQWWCHLFLPEQPDLDWTNPDVHREFEAIIGFWLDRGVDGFRIDVAQGLLKHPSFADNPRRAHPPAGDDARSAFEAYEHHYDIGQIESAAIFERWRRLTDPRDAVLMGEVYLDVTAVAPYLTGEGLHLAFSFAFVDLPWDRDAVLGALRTTLTHLDRRACWTQTSHDEPRPPTRFGGGPAGRARALALATLLAGMPGPFVLYQGEELGLEDGTVPDSAAVDPMGGRDGCRTPIPWGRGRHWGFTDGEPWLPMGNRSHADTVEAQLREPTSPLQRHRALLAVRRSIDPAAGLEWLPTPHPLVAYRRGRHVVGACVADEAAPLELPSGSWHLVFSTRSNRAMGAAVEGSVMLDPAEAVIVETAAREG